MIGLRWIRENRRIIGLGIRWRVMETILVYIGFPRSIERPIKIKARVECCRRREGGGRRSGVLSTEKRLVVEKKPMNLDER